MFCILPAIYPQLPLCRPTENSRSTAARKLEISLLDTAYMFSGASVGWFSMGHANTFVFQQAPFVLECTERSQILGQLHCSQIGSVQIAHGKITDMYKPVTKVDPKFRYILFPSTKILQNLVNRFHTSGRMTVLNLASDDRLTASENAIRTLGEKSDAIISINERKI